MLEGLAPGVIRTKCFTLMHLKDSVRIGSSRVFFDGGGFNNYFQDISHIPFLGLLLHPNSKGPHL